jgi:WD40 repeat protein
MTIFAEALEQPDPAARATYLNRACGGDAALRGRVEALLAAHAGAGRFLEPDATDKGDTPTHIPSDATAAFEPQPQPMTEMVTGASHPKPVEDTVPADRVSAPAPPTVIAGRYALIELIGEGGMGSVYLAEQTEPVKRQVALKLIKAGADSKAVLARFDAERQALALMDHPNIARVYDGGTTAAGQPFFVMELVQGVPLTEYCDQKRLPLKARLELFVAVCQAVQHAHQKGIIHRDLKPSNVLVTEVDSRPTPKVIDFGVAKATEVRLTDLSYADTGAIVGTPAYMSPEQADPSSMDIDTRTDVYALGVMLYELLVGSPPIDARQFKRGALLEMLRMVREVDPPRPSTKLSAADDLPNIAAARAIEPAKLARSLRGELDWVVMKALEKDRSRRYDSANGLARDLQRYLADEVVEARPPSRGYRLKKFVRRHKGQVIAASLVLLALVVGIVGTSIGLVRADREREKADRERETAEGLADQNGKLAVEERDAKNKASELATANAQLADSESKQKNKAIANADELKYQLGVSSMVLANAAYDNHDLELAAERLDKVPEEQRGWEWHYLKRQLHGGIFTLSGHKGGVASVVFSPDGTRIVTGSVNVYMGMDGEGPFEAKVWDARTGTPLFDLKGLPPNAPAGGPVNIAFSPDSKRIVTAGGDQTARVWDAATGALQLELKEPAGTVNGAAFSPDGTQIVTGSGGLVKLWDARTGKALLDWKAQGVARVAFSPDGGRILTGDLYEGAVRVWDAKTGKVLLEAKGMMSAHSVVAFSPDGQRIVVGRMDGTARVIDATTGKVLLELRGRPIAAISTLYGFFGVLCVAFSPDGTRIVTGGTTGRLNTGWACVWDARTGAELLELKGHSNQVMSAAFSPDGQRIITGSADHTAKVWDARTGTARLEMEGGMAGAECAAFSPDGTWIVAGRGYGAAGATVWDARSGMPRFSLKGIEGYVSAVAVSKDGTRIVTGGGEVGDAGSATVWDAQTGQLLITLEGFTQRVKSVSFNPDGTRIVTGVSCEPRKGVPYRGQVKEWDAQTGAVLRDLTPAGGVGRLVWAMGDSVAFSRDGTRIVLGGYSGGSRAKVVDARTAATLVELIGHERPVTSVAISGDGKRIATGSVDQLVKVWDAERGGPALLDLKGHTGHVFSVAFSPDGKRIVSGSGDRTVRVWDAQTGTTLAELKGHTGAVSSVSFSADGTRILTASGLGAEKGEVFVWDARMSKEPPDAEEIAWRRDEMQPNPWRYRAGYLAARAARDDFAAAFYLNLIPPDERRGVLDAEAVADLSKRADEAGKLEEAVPLLIEILNVNKARLGPEDPDTIRAAEKLSEIYQRMGQREKSIPLLEDALKQRKAKFGREHQLTRDAMLSLVQAYREAGRLKEAVAVLEETAARNPEPIVTRDLLDICELAGEHAKIIARCHKELAAIELAPTPKQGPANPWRQADLLVRLGRAYLAQKQWSEAEPHLRQCLAFWEKNRSNDWMTFEAQSLLGGSLWGQKKYADAEPLLLKGYEGLKQRRNSLESRDAPRLKEAVERLVQFYEATDKKDEAAKWRKEREAIQAADKKPQK